MYARACMLLIASLTTLLLGVSLGVSALDATPAASRCSSSTPCGYKDQAEVPTLTGRGLLEAHGGRNAGKSDHKPLLPTSQYDVAMFVVAGIVLFIAAGAGMGGGPVLVPLYLTLGAFHQQAAVALSNSTILAGSVANVLVNARKRHPFRNKPLVDWDLILLMQPPTLIGAIAGSYINKMLPAWISHLLLALLLTLMTVRVLQRASMIYKKESAALQQPCTESSAAEASAVSDCHGAAISAAAAAPAASPTPGGGAVQLAVLNEASSPVKDTPSGAPAPAVSAPADSSSSNSTTKAAAAGSMRRASSSRLGASLQTSPARQQQLQDQVRHPDMLQLKPLQQQQQQRSSSREGVPTDGLMPSEVECRLAYAPPGHTRRSSWEVQGGWDDAWEVHSCEAESSRSQLAAPQEQHRDAQLHGASSSSAGERALLNSGRAESAPLDDSIVPQLSTPTSTPVKAAAAAVGLGAAAGCHSFSSRVHSCGTLAPVTTAADAHAVVQRTCAADASISSSSFSKQRQHRHQQQQQQPPELSLHSPELQAMLTAEAAQLPLVPVLLLFVLFLAVMLTSLFSKSCKCGSVGFWLVQWVVAPVLLAVWCFSRGRVLKKVAVKRVAGLDFHGDIRWTRHNSIIFPAICSLAGVIAGMFGLGGAVVKTPLMLELGVQPQVTAATTQTMLLLTTAASTIVYSQLGDIPWEYAAVLMPMAFAATLAGQYAIDWVVKKLGRSSVVVIVLAAFFVVACGLTYYICIDSLKVVAADPVGATVPGKICSGG